VPLVANGNLTFGSHGSTPGILVTTVASLTIAPRGMAVVADPGPGNHSNRTLLILTSLSFSSLTSGVLDLAGNDLDLPNGNLAQITAAIATGYNGSGFGDWNGGAGIISSTAAADTTQLTTLGVIQNNVAGSTTPLYGTSGALGKFDGISPASTDILVKYTYFGDTNLDGKVDGSDYSRLDAGLLDGATGWYNGDFNYDGVINGSDYALIDNTFNTQGASLATAINPAVQVTTEIANVIPVPEPTDSVLLGVGMLGILSSRRRNKRRKILPGQPLQRPAETQIHSDNPYQLSNRYFLIFL